jgi:hypothetical protein
MAGSTRASVTALVLAVGLANCSGGVTPFTPQSLPAPGSVASIDDLTPRAPCPIVGQTYTRAKASTRVTRGLTSASKSTKLSWTVVFTGQPSATPPVNYTPALIACSPPNGKKPIGKVALLPGGSTHATSNNGVWTITVRYEVQYNAPAKVPGNKNWKYDLVRFTAPKGYGPLPGIIVEVFK